MFPPKSIVSFADLTQLRDTFVSEMVPHTSSASNRCRLFEGISFPEHPRPGQWSLAVRAKLRKLQCSRSVRFKLISF